MKKILASVLAILMLLTSVSGGAIYEVIGGRLGKCVWTLDQQEGVLAIRGNGELTGTDPQPWQDYADEIKMIVFEDGITSIPDNFLTGCVNLTTIYFPANITSIGSGTPSVSSKIQLIGFSGEITTVRNAMRDEADRKIIDRLGVQYASYDGKTLQVVSDGQEHSAAIGDDGNVVVEDADRVWHTQQEDEKPAATASPTATPGEQQSPTTIIEEDIEDESDTDTDIEENIEDESDTDTDTEETLPACPTVPPVPYESSEGEISYDDSNPAAEMIYDFTDDDDDD